jgi:hypothetical protein
MTNKPHENIFKFGLYLGEDTVNEKIFTADFFNPVIRYSVDIREDIPYIILRLQKVLSRRNLTYKADVGGHTYDLLGYYKNQIDLERKQFHNKLRRISSPAEFKFGLYINGNPIVERNFPVDNYNSSSRFSNELKEIIDDITDEIFSSLKESDVNHMWDDYVLINTYGLYINQIRDLSKGKRALMLSNVKNRGFIKKTRTNYNGSSN